MSQKKCFLIATILLEIIILWKNMLQITVPENISEMQLEDILSHIQSYNEFHEGDIERERFYYADSNFEIFGSEAGDLINRLCKEFSNQLTYATDGMDFHQYVLVEAGKFRKQFDLDHRR